MEPSKNEEQSGSEAVPQVPPTETVTTRKEQLLASLGKPVEPAAPAEKTPEESKDLSIEDLQKNTQQELERFEKEASGEYVDPKTAKKLSDETTEQKKEDPVKEPELPPEPPEEPPFKSLKNSILRPLRTYKDDIAEAMKRDKTSVVTIAAAESVRREKRRLETRMHEQVARKPLPIKQILVTSLSVLLIGAGSFSVYFVYTTFIAPLSSVPEPEEQLLFGDARRPILLKDLSRSPLMNTLTKEALGLRATLDTITLLTPVMKNELGVEEPVPTDTFLRALDLHAPDSLLRSFQPTFVFGVHVFDGNEPFFLFKTNFFENAFAGMLAWEPAMSEDLAPLFGPKVVPLFSLTAPITASSTSADIAYEDIGVFNDVVIRNKDTRVLRDENGEIVLLYSFLDQETLLITTNEYTFRELFVRLTSSRVLR
jgi:hypothetical protein